MHREFHLRVHQSQLLPRPIDQLQSRQHAEEPFAHQVAGPYHQFRMHIRSLSNFILNCNEIQFSRIHLLFRRLCYWCSRSIRNSIFGRLFKGWVVSWFPVNIRRTGLSRTTVVGSFGCFLLYVLSIKAYRVTGNSKERCGWGKGICR